MSRSETWKRIDGKPDKRVYEVSDLGRVRSISPKGKTRILKPGICDGYYIVYVYGKMERVHRLVAEAFIDNPNLYPVVNHKDFNRKNNSIENLEWCTQKQNAIYSSHRLRSPHNAKLPKTGEKYIHHYSVNGYYVQIRSLKGHIFRKSYGTLRQAIEGRDEYLRSVGYE